MSIQGGIKPRFFLSQAEPCAYLPDQVERKVFTLLAGEGADDLHALLSEQGFRRSQLIAYRPACGHCKACVAVRVRAPEFRPSPSQRRTARQGAMVKAFRIPLEATKEQYQLFRRYLSARHENSSMRDMDFMDYARVIEDSQVSTRLIEYRALGSANHPEKHGKLVGMALTDLLGDGLSMVYSFFDPEFTKASLGTLMILDHIKQAAEEGLPYLYLGYWVAKSPQMAYKIKFMPQEHFTDRGWVPYDCAPSDSA